MAQALDCVIHRKAVMAVQSARERRHVNRGDLALLRVVPAAAGAVAGRERREEGFTLVEVVVALGLLVLVLVPTADLMLTSGKVLATNRSEIVAANLASGCLEQDRAIEDAAGTWPVTSLPGCSTSGGGAAYSIEQHTGWCYERSGTWTTYPPSGVPETATNPPAFAELATVTWANGARSLSVGQVLTTPYAAVASVPYTSTDPLYSPCPL
jgi:type II secretory pathway pseudopilin PulG